MHKFTLSFTLIVLSIFQLAVLSFSKDISDSCIACICEASTGCDLKYGCDPMGICGPFRLTLPFWQDAGMNRPIGSQPDITAFKECAKNAFCASESIRGYSKRYATDCNGNGVYDCDDYARIHKMGPHGCVKKEFTDMSFYKKFNSCCTSNCKTGFL